MLLKYWVILSLQVHLVSKIIICSAFFSWSGKLPLYRRLSDVSFTCILNHKHLIDVYLTSKIIERVSSFKYLGVNISEDLTWTAHIQTQVKKARQRLYHLRQLRKFRVSPAILKTFYSGAIESVLTQCISVWYNNATNQDCKALQRVVRLAERISGSALPSLQDIYLKRCKSRTAKIIKDSNHPGNHLFILLPSGRRYRSMLAKTERLRRSFFPQAIRLLNSVS